MCQGPVSFFHTYAQPTYKTKIWEHACCFWKLPEHTLIYTVPMISERNAGTSERVSGPYFTFQHDTISKAKFAGKNVAPGSMLG